VTRIEAIAEVGADRKLSIDLPPEVSEGKHRVMVLLLDDETASGANDDSSSESGNLEWEGNLLVYNGPVPAQLDICRMIELDREERTIHVMFGGD
jgi:hypothetical protein